MFIRFTFGDRDGDRFLHEEKVHRSSLLNVSAAAGGGGGGESAPRPSVTTLDAPAAERGDGDRGTGRAETSIVERSSGHREAPYKSVC